MFYLNIHYLKTSFSIIKKIISYFCAHLFIFKGIIFKVIYLFLRLKWLLKTKILSLFFSMRIKSVLKIFKQISLFAAENYNEERNVTNFS